MSDPAQGGTTGGVDRIHVHCEVRGRGRPLLLILGLGADVSEHAPLIDALAEHSQVVAFDNRGAGRSDKPDAPYTIELMAEDALGVLDVLGIPHADVLGMSLGGRIALELTLRHHERVDKLMLLSTSARVVPSWRRHLYPILAGLPWGRSSHPQPRYAFRRQLEASNGYDATDRLGEITVPTLILHGRRDRSAPLALAEEMRSRIPGARMQVFRGGHLFFLLRDRRRFLGAVAEFIAEG
ncbi:MAG: alpha/beta fold hydrolase [Candidatus Dormibacteria bacterium]